MRTFLQGIILDGASAVYLGLQSVPFLSDLSTYHKTITDNTFAESIQNLPATFLPRVAKFNGIDDVIDFDTDIVIPTNAAFEITFGVVINNYITGAIVLGSNSVTSNYIFLLSTFGIRLNYGAQANDFTTIQLDEGVFQEIKISGDGTNITVQNITKSLTETQVASVDNVIIGKVGARANNTLFLDGFLTELTLPNNIYILSGQGNYEYDISGNESHIIWSGNGNRYSYSLNGSDYPNKNGYSLWQHATLEEIQVPYDINGLPLSLIAGTNIPTGYTKTKDVVTGGVNWNMQDALIDFENLGESAIDIFDRSNVTIQNTISRASNYYDAANPYRYHLSEIDARSLNNYYNDLYKDKVFLNAIFNSELIRIDEILNYQTKKVTSNLSTVLDYINILSTYPTDINIEIPRDTPGIEYWVRPLGQVYGTGSGDSYVNAFTGFGGIANLSPGDILHVRGTHNEYFLCGSKVGLGTDTNYVTIDFGADTETDFGIIDLLNAGNNGIDAASRYNIGFEYPRGKNVNVSGVSLNSACYNFIFRNGDFSFSGNQGTQLLSTSKAIYYKCTSHNNIDDGFSQHDSTEGKYYYCDSNNNAQGWNTSPDPCTMNLYGCTGSDNSDFDVGASATSIINDYYGSYEKPFDGDVTSLRLYKNEL